MGSVLVFTHLTKDKFKDNALTINIIGASLITVGSLAFIVSLVFVGCAIVMFIFKRNIIIGNH